jgi:S-adenosylmethionine synthetase
LVQIAYAIGRASPLAVNIDSYGTGTLPDDRLRSAVLKTFDLRPGAIIDRFQLRRPIYEPFSAYGHFGRTDIETPWEALDLVEELKRSAA